jgi:hypothetical protein
MTQQAEFNQQLMKAVEQQNTQSEHGKQRGKVCIPKAIQVSINTNYQQTL